MCPICDQKIIVILNFFQKVFFYLSITILSLTKQPLSNTLQYNYALMPANPRKTSDTHFLVSPTASLSIFLLNPPLLNRSKTLSFYRCLQFWEEGKVSGRQVRWIRWLRHGNGFAFGQNLIHKNGCLSWCVIIVQNPRLIFSKFCVFLTNCFAQSPHNFKVVFLIDCTILWQGLMMQHVIIIEQNIEKNLHIWSNLMYFFRSWLFWMLPLESFGFSFNAMIRH